MPILSDLGQRVGVAISQLNRGFALQNLGHHVEARSCYERAGPILAELNQWSGSARYQLDLSVALQNPGQFLTNSLERLQHAQKSECGEDLLQH